MWVNKHLDSVSDFGPLLQHIRYLYPIFNVDNAEYVILILDDTLIPEKSLEELSEHDCH